LDRARIIRDASERQLPACAAAIATRLFGEADDWSSAPPLGQLVRRSSKEIQVVLPVAEGSEAHAMLLTLRPNGTWSAGWLAYRAKHVIGIRRSLAIEPWTELIGCGLHDRDFDNDLNVPDESLREELNIAFWHVFNDTLEDPVIGFTDRRLCSRREGLHPDGESALSRVLSDAARAILPTGSSPVAFNAKIVFDPGARVGKCWFSPATFEHRASFLQLADLALRHANPPPTGAHFPFKVGRAARRLSGWRRGTKEIQVMIEAPGSAHDQALGRRRLYEWAGAVGLDPLSIEKLLRASAPKIVN
jgi:hypothetical protein